MRPNNICIICVRSTVIFPEGKTEDQEESPAHLHFETGLRRYTGMYAIHCCNGSVSRVWCPQQSNVRPNGRKLKVPLSNPPSTWCHSSLFFFPRLQYCSYSSLFSLETRPPLAQYHSHFHFTHSPFYPGWTERGATDAPTRFLRATTYVPSYHEVFHRPRTGHGELKFLPVRALVMTLLARFKFAARASRADLR